MTSPLAELAAAAATAADAPPPAPEPREAASEPPAKRRKGRGSVVDAATSRLTSAQLQLNVLLATVQQAYDVSNSGCEQIFTYKKLL